MGIDTLVVGLGNPGSAHARQRHNVGFLAVEHVAEAFSFSPFMLKGNAHLSQAHIYGRDVLLCLPMTYMNLSGEAVAPLIRFYKISMKNVVVIHDELDLSLGDVRWKEGGGHNGHNGLRSISAHCGNEYGRVRIGIGRPPFGKSDVSAYVLGNFLASETKNLEGALKKSLEMMDFFLAKKRAD